jgi:hypothetical protein
MKSVFLELIEKERKDAATLIQRKWRQIHGRKCGWCKTTILMNQLYWSSELCDHCYEEREEIERENMGICHDCGEDLYDCRGYCVIRCRVCGDDADGGPYDRFCSRSCMRIAISE